MKVLGPARGQGSKEGKQGSGSLCPVSGMAVTGTEAGVASAGVTRACAEGSAPIRHTLRTARRAGEHQTHGTALEPRSYLSDVFKGKLSSCQAGRANGGLAHRQPGRPGHLLSSPGQLGRLPGLNVDPVETRPGGSGPTGGGGAHCHGPLLCALVATMGAMFQGPGPFIQAFPTCFCFVNVKKEQNCIPCNIYLKIW